jgi:hypothetical protein
VSENISNRNRITKPRLAPKIFSQVSRRAQNSLEEEKKQSSDLNVPDIRGNKNSSDSLPQSSSEDICEPKRFSEGFLSFNKEKIISKH